jgi:hypothetical protein
LIINGFEVHDPEPRAPRPLNAIIGLTEMMVKNAARFGTEKGAGAAVAGYTLTPTHTNDLFRFSGH